MSKERDFKQGQTVYQKTKYCYRSFVFGFYIDDNYCYVLADDALYPEDCKTYKMKVSDLSLEPTC